MADNLMNVDGAVVAKAKSADVEDTTIAEMT